MTLKKLASEIAKREGKKSQARIGDIREILKIIVQMECVFGMGASGYDDGPAGAIHRAALAKLAPKARGKK